MAVQISTTLNGRCLAFGGSVDGLLIDLALASAINVSMFKTGKAAMIINGDWSWGDYNGIIDFGIARIPKVSET